MKLIPEIKEPEFEAKALESRRTVLVNTCSSWSQRCRVQAGVLDEAAAECAGRFKAVKVNADDHPDLCLRHRRNQAS